MGERARQQKNRRPGLIGDMWFVIKRERKWWLIPLIAVLSIRTDRHPAGPASSRSQSDGHGSRPSARIPDISAVAAPTGRRDASDDESSLPLPTWSRSASRPAAGSSLHEPTTGRASTLALPGGFGQSNQPRADFRRALKGSLRT